VGYTQIIPDVCAGGTQPFLVLVGSWQQLRLRTVSLVRPERRPYQTHVDRQRDAKARTERPTWVFWSEADCHFIHHYLSLLVSVSLRSVPVPILIELIN
jgi:hypothetical protein